MPFKKSSAAQSLHDDLHLEAEPADSSRVVTAGVEASTVSELSAKASALIRAARAGLKPSPGDRRRVSTALGLDLDLDLDLESGLIALEASVPRRGKRQH